MPKTKIKSISRRINKSGGLRERILAIVNSFFCVKRFDDVGFFEMVEFVDGREKWRKEEERCDEGK